jgi:hypothetical protein
MNTPRRPGRIPPGLDIPVLTDLADESMAPAAAPMAATAPAPAPLTAPAMQPVLTISQDLLSQELTERIAALTDRLLRDATAEIHATLVEKVWEKLQEEIPGIVEEVLRGNAQDD